AHYRQALTLAEELGLRPLAAHCHLGLGELYRRAGTRLESREHLTTAGAVFGEMDMQYWREKAEMAMTERTGGISSRGIWGSRRSGADWPPSWRPPSPAIAV